MFCFITLLNDPKVLFGQWRIVYWLLKGIIYYSKQTTFEYSTTFAFPKYMQSWKIIAIYSIFVQLTTLLPY